jgi:hypothetical protein
MAKMKPRVQTDVVLFDVFYDDGSRASNRKVPADSLGGLDGDEPARAFMDEQERKIAEMSGKPARTIDRIVRSGR